MEVTGNGLIAAYIHTGAKVGVLVEVGAGKESTVASDEFKQLVKISRFKLPPVIRSLFRASRFPRGHRKGKRNCRPIPAEEQAAASHGKIIEGKLEKFYQSYCLVDQGFVKTQFRGQREGAHWLHREAFG